MIKLAMEIIKAKDKLTDLDLEKVVNVLRDGGIVVYPTETCYGIGSLASHKKGVSKLIRYNRRPEGKAISVALRDRKMAEKYVLLNETAENIYKNFLPGPYTVISKSKENTDRRLESETGTLGIRIPDHIIPIQIVSKLDEGITATSANLSGGSTPYSIDSLLESLPEGKKELIDLIIDYGRLPRRPSSTVIDTTTSVPSVLRGTKFHEQILKSFHRTGKKISNSEQETIDIIKEFLTNKPDLKVILFSGDLGAGKTHATKAIAQYLEINEPILSPTYVFERQYKNPKTRKTLYHYDFWRLNEIESENETILKDIGLENALRDNASIISIEWPERVEGIINYINKLTQEMYIISISQTSETGREISIYQYKN